jgi:hypothetical protein
MMLEALIQLNRGAFFQTQILSCWLFEEIHSKNLLTCAQTTKLIITQIPICYRWEITIINTGIIVSLYFLIF